MMNARQTTCSPFLRLGLLLLTIVAPLFSSLRAAEQTQVLNHFPAS